MSHDRGCFKCGEDVDYSGCKDPDCPKRHLYSNHPVSLAEVRSSKTQNAADWTPRDALITVLRKIDRGEIAPEAIIIAWAQFKPGGVTDFGFQNAAPNIIVSTGLLENAKIKLYEAGE